MKFFLALIITFASWYVDAHVASRATTRQVQQAIDVPITIQEGVGAASFATSGFPVAVVVPFAKGTVFDESTLSILEGNPCQLLVLERWLSDGSIRHVQVLFQATVTANSRQTVRLINNGPSPKPLPPKPVAVVNDASYVQVDTGRVRFRISKTSFNLIDQLWFDQNENNVYESNELMVASNVENGGRFVPRAEAGATQRDSARGDIVVEIEEAGPLRAVIKVSASTIFRSTTDHVHGFAVRFYAYAGQPHIKVDYQLRNSALNAVRSWPLYFEEMTADWSFQLPGTTSPKITFGSTTRRLYNATRTPCRLQQLNHDRYTVVEIGSVVSEESSVAYSSQAKNAAFVHLQSATTGATVILRNFWQAWPNGLAMVGNSKVSVELFPPWSAQYTTTGLSSTGLYWLNDMQQVYKEFMISFHSSAPSANRLFDLASTFQFPPVASVSPSWYRSTRATLDLSGWLPTTLPAPANPDTFSPDQYWDSFALEYGGGYYKGNWMNFGEVEGIHRSRSCTTGGYPHDAEFYTATQYAAHYYVAETWGMGEVNVRPQMIPLYNFLADYGRLKLTQVGYCNGSWRIFEGNGVSKFAAPPLPGTEPTPEGEPIIIPYYGARDDQHGWFYHVAESYFYTGSYWLKDWYKFVGQFRRDFLTLQQPFQDDNSRAIAHALGHTWQAIRVTGELALITEFANYFRVFLRPRRDLQYGSEFNSTNGIQQGYQTGFLMRTIINYMDLVRDFDVQLYAELFNYLSGIMERNLNVGNFAELHNQYTTPGKGISHPNSLPMIAPQAWYYWHTGKIQFWKHVQDYMNGNLGEKPYGAPWTRYPDVYGYGIYGLRFYIFVLQSTRQDQTPPNAITDLSVSLSSGQATLQWTGPATAVRYHAVWSDKPIVGSYSLSNTVSNWWAADAIGIPGVAKPGVRETFSITLPNIKSGNYVAIFSFDQSDNMSQMSNVATVGGPSAPVTPTAPIPQMAPITAPITPSAPLPVSPPQSGNVIHIYQGDNFETTVERLQPGDIVIVHQGDYFNTGRISIAVAGTSTLPVVVQGAANEGRPRILRSSTAAIQNTINIEGATHLTIKGLEILSNGGDGIKIGPGVRGSSHITLEDLVIHDVAVGINSQTNVDTLIVRKCHIYDTSDTGEGLYLGCSDGSCIVSNSLIDNNWVHDTLNSDQGDGIELKKNSFGNIIRNNVVYNTKYPGILLYGSGGGARNVVEGNVMWNCAKGGIQVAADAVVQNNLVFQSGYGLLSQLHNEVDPKNLKIVHNTFLNNGVCLNIRAWNGKSDIIFANNAVYCTSDTMDLQGGTQNVQLAGNVFFPGAAAFPSGSFVLGRGIAQDFGSGSFNAYPTVDSPLRTAADARYATVSDFDGTMRSAPVDVGGYEWFSTGRKWTVQAGFKPSNEMPTPPSPQVGPVSPPISVSPTIPVPRPVPSPQPLPITPFPIAPIAPIPLPPVPRFNGICFSDRNTVKVYRGHEYIKAAMVSPKMFRTIPISDLAVGDYVPSGKGNGVTQVISFCHRDPHFNASFVRMHRTLLFVGPLNASSEIAVPLEMSADHLVLVLRHGSESSVWIRAADVQVGDRLIGRDGPQVVSSIEMVQRTGVYAPITESGTLRVSGAVVSSYVAVLQVQRNESSYVPMFPPHWQHSIGHVILTPIRLLCRFRFKYCQEERYDEHGYTWYSKIILRFHNFFDCGKGFVPWMMPVIATVHVFATVLVSVVFVLLHGMEHLLFGSGPMDLEDAWNVGSWIAAGMTSLLTVYIVRLFARKQLGVTPGI